MAKGSFLRSWAVRGALLTLLSRGIALVVQLGTLVVLAHFLSEREFGLAWMVAVVVGVAGVGADLGMDVVAVQRRGVDDFRAALLSEIAGSLLCGLVAWTAPLLSLLFGEPLGLTDLIRVGALGLMMAGFGAPALARLRRALAFKHLAGVAVVRAFAQGAIAIAFALTGFGAWSIVLADVFAGGVAAALAWLLASAMQKGTDTDLLGDGARVVGVRLSDAGFAQADRFFVGSRLGAGALGLYGFAWRHAMVLVQNLMPVAEQVALPIFSRLQDDRDALVRAYLALTRWLALAIVPAAALLHGLAPWLVDWIYPDRWDAAVPAMRALCVAAAAAGLNSDPGLLWLALGRTRLRLSWSVANLVVIVPLVWVGTRYGIEGVAYLLAARSLAATVVAQVITNRVAGVPHAGYARAVAPGLVVGGLLLLV